MENIRSVKNAAWIIACKIVQSVLGLVIGMISARYLGPSNYGIINYAASVVAFVVPITQLGLRSTLVQEIINAPKKEGKILGSALVFEMAASLLGMVGVTAFAMIVNRTEKDTIIVCALYSISLFFQATELTQYWFQAKLLSKYTSLTMLSAYIIVSVYKIYLLVSEKSVHWFAISQALDYALISVILLIIYKKIADQKLSFSFKLGMEMLSKSKYFIISGLMVVVFAQTDKIMIKLMIDNTAEGYYSAAVACASMTSFVFTAIIDSMRPMIFEAKNESELLFQRRVAELYSIIIYFAFAQCLVISVFSKLMIRILYGAAYLPAAPSLSIVVWYTTFSYIGSVRNIWLLAQDLQKYLWRINLAGAAANIVLNFLLIPRMGIIGAAIASLVTQFFTNVVIGFIFKPLRPNNSLMMKGLDPRLMVAEVKQLSVILRRKKKS